MRVPPDGVQARDRERRSIAARRVARACWAAVSSAGCSAWPRRAWATRSSCSIPARDSPAGQRRRPPHPRRLPRSATACAELAALAARGDDRVRERAGGGARVPRAHRARDAGRGERRDRAGPDQREDVPRGPRLRRRAVRGAAQRGRRAQRRRRRCCPGIVKSARFGYDGKGQIRVAHARRRRARRWRAMGGVPCVLEQLRRARLRGLGDRRAQRARRRPRPGRWPRTAIATASSTCRSCRRACPPTLAAQARATSRPRVAAALDYRGVLCVEMFVAARRRAARQRDRAAPAQQRPLHDRRLRDVAVRAAGARARRPAARRHAAARRRR